jgi:hypothetical protein
MRLEILTQLAVERYPGMSVSNECRWRIRLAAITMRAMPQHQEPIMKLSVMKLTGSLTVMAAVAISGCGASDRIDATSQESLGQSIKRIKAGMPKADQDALAKDLATVTFAANAKTMVANALSKTSNKSFISSEMFKPLHGLTAAQVHEKAELIRREAAAKPKTN